MDDLTNGIYKRSTRVQHGRRKRESSNGWRKKLAMPPWYGKVQLLDSHTQFRADPKTYTYPFKLAFAC